MAILNALLTKDGPEQLQYLKNYVSDKKYDFLISEIGIPSGKYNNPMFDEITVTYNDLKKISTEQNDWNFHIYNGTKDKIKKFSDELSLAGYANIISYAPSYANIFYYVPYFVLIFSEILMLSSITIRLNEMYET